ncbi:MAG TPA: sigma-54 dependent transcriptional regulator [Verrucomicrobiae bacterium]|nr:sigma-54 dependent transcriptional regulator [Verrucomicrobiae bacterium]
MQNLFESEVADFILTPLRAIDVIPRLLRLLQHVGKSESLWGHLKEQLGLRQFVGESSLLLQEIRKIPKLAQCDVSILIGGETGTGKEMFARAIHYLSPRSDKPFIPVNCGALPAELVENELFGHAEGAFTGATSSAAGLISESDGGTMFLDEIDALPLPSQAKLLRFVQEKEFRPLGSCKTRKADVRVLAASNIKFEEAVRSGRFRADLYYRLNVIPISLPALRHRKEDIPPLVRHLLTKYASELRKPLPALSRLAMQKLMSYDWPGNVRELENTIERALILSDHPTIGCEDILLPSTLAATPDTSFKSLKAKVIADFEYKYIRELLLAYDGNITRAATAAKKNRRAFWQLMKKHDITVPSAAFS